MLKVIFIMLALAATSAQADCKKYNPDGTVEACEPMAAPVMRDPLAYCAAGVKLAHDAYLEATYDAKAPDSKRLHYVVDYLGDMQQEAFDRKMAHKSADYIAARLKPTGIRHPWSAVVYEAAREFMMKECKQ